MRFAIGGEVELCGWGRGKLGWTSIPLLKKTMAKKKKGRTKCPDSSTSQTPKNKLRKSKATPKLRPALTLTDEQAALATPESNRLYLQLRKR